MKEDNFLNREMKKTMFKVFILRRIANSKVNSYSLLKEIVERRSRRFPGNANDIKNDVYNTINSLENSNYIKSSSKIENGRSKNYYTLTSKGRTVLESARKIFKKNMAELAAVLGE